jgi:hypothetical protein
MDNQVSSRNLFKVPAENIDLLRRQIEVVNQRVARLVKRGHDVPPVSISTGHPYSVKRPGESNERLYVDVELLSPKPPKVEGWEFVAALSHVEGVGTVLRVCPGATVSEGELKKYREASPDNCDHCHTSRKRNDTFVIRDRDGQLSQVGRQCLEAYTGLANPTALCSTAEILFSLSSLLEDSEDDAFDQSFGGAGGAGGRYVTIECFLPFVCCSIREDGWLSRTAATNSGRRAESTCDLAFSRGVYAKPGDDGRYLPTSKDIALAAETIEQCESYFAEREVDSLTDYENSLRVAMASGIAHPKFAGLIASSVGFYQMEVERRVRKDSWSKMTTDSTFQGKVGERRVFEDLKVLWCRTWESDFGSTYFYTLSDGRNNSYAYKSSRDMELSVGQVVSFQAKVKKHEMYTPKREGAKPYAQTVLTRCSFVARARLVSVETVERLSTKLVVTNPDQVQLGFFAEYERPNEKVLLAHLEMNDGRKCALTLKSKKRLPPTGSEIWVSYEANPVLVNGEVPVSLITNPVLVNGEVPVSLITNPQGGSL